MLGWLACCASYLGQLFQAQHLMGSPRTAGPLPTCPTTAGVLRATSQMYLFGLNFTGVLYCSA